MLFTLKLLHFMNDLTYLNSGLCLPNYALFSNHDRGYQSAWESLTVCFFINSYLNIVINTQTFRYLVGHFPVKSTKELLEN